MPYSMINQKEKFPKKNDLWRLMLEVRFLKSDVSIAFINVVILLSFFSITFFYYYS